VKGGKSPLKFPPGRKLPNGLQTVRKKKHRGRRRSGDEDLTSPEHKRKTPVHPKSKTPRMKKGGKNKISISIVKGKKFEKLNWKRAPGTPTDRGTRPS